MNEEGEGVHVHKLVAADHRFEEVFSAANHVGCAVDDLNFDGRVGGRYV